MRTTLNIDEELLNEVLCETGENDKGKAVNAALADFIRRKKVEKLLALRGKIDIDDKWEEWEEAEMADEAERLKGWNE